MKRQEKAVRSKAIIPVTLLIALLIPSVLLAAACPDFANMGSLKAASFEPYSVSVDSAGNAYSTDYFNDTLRVFTYKGVPSKTEYIKPPKTAQFENLTTTGPLGVAVDGAGRVFVGRTDDRNGAYTGEVIVFSGTNTYKLGNGYGEFEYPASIAVGGSVVYVADSRKNVVKAYDAATGQFKFSFGGYKAPSCPTPKSADTSTCPKDSDKACFTANDCTTNFTYVYEGGNLVRPVGVAVHPVTGDVYVADKAMQCPGSPDLQGGSCYNWGVGGAVHIFDENGTFIKRFGSYGAGTTAGSLNMPAGIAIVGDSASGYAVIVSDSSSGYLQVFDDAGNALCLGPRPGQPQGLAAGADGRLFAAAQGGVSIFGVGGYTTMDVTPDPLVISSAQCSTSFVTSTLNITNNGLGKLDWSVSSDHPDSIVPAVLSGSVLGKSSYPLVISADPNGTMEGKLTVASQAVTEEVDVKVSVSKPSLTVGPDALFFETKGADVPAAQKLNVTLTNDTAGTLNWGADTGSEWITISPSSGPASTLSLATVSVDPSKVTDTGGSFTGYITVTAGCALGSPTVVPVKLTKEEIKGALKVTTNVPAPVTIGGAASGSTGGLAPYSYIVSVPAGTYTVAFGAVSGYKTPVSLSVAVPGGGMVEVIGEYKDLRAKKGIIATMGSGQWFVPDELKVFDGAGALEGSLTLGSGTKTRTGAYIKEGKVTVAGDVDGDGEDEIIVGNEKGVITAVNADGSAVPGLSFSAFSYGSGLSVAVADLDGDGIGEIIVGAGTKAGNPAAVRVFSYKGGAVADTGINFLAYSEMYGVTVSAGDVDGDGAAEVVTVPGGGSTSVRIWKADVSGGMGGWKMADAGGFSAGMSALAADVSAADLDGDAVDEIVVARVPSASDGTATIAAYEADGTKSFEFVVSAKGGVDITAGDIDMDGKAEIVVGEGVDTESLSSVRIYKNAALSKEFLAFNNLDIYGVRVSLGRVGGAK